VPPKSDPTSANHHDRIRVNPSSVTRYYGANAKSLLKAGALHRRHALARIATKQAKYTLDQLHAELAGKLLDNKNEAACGKEGNMAFAKTEREWAERAARHLKAELKRADLTYEELAARMKKHGFKETRPASPTSSRARPCRRIFSLLP
jgi:hypothetical protein